MGIPIPKITGLKSIGSALGITSARNVDARNRMAGDALASLVGDIKSKEIINEHQAKATEYAGAQAGKAARTEGLTSMLGSIASPFISWGTNSFANNMNVGSMDTNQLVARDNQTYGNTFPVGSFGSGSGTYTPFGSAIDTNINRHSVGLSSNQPNIFGYNSPHAW